MKEEAVTYEQHYEQKYEGMTIAQLAKTMKKIKEQHEAKKRQAAQIWHEYDYLRMRAIVMKMEEMGIESVYVKGVGRLSTREEAGCKTLD